MWWRQILLTPTTTDTTPLLGSEPVQGIYTGIPWEIKVTSFKSKYWENDNIHGIRALKCKLEVDK